MMVLWVVVVLLLALSAPLAAARDSAPNLSEYVVRNDGHNFPNMAGYVFWYNETHGLEIVNGATIYHERPMVTPDDLNVVNDVVADDSNESIVIIKITDLIYARGHCDCAIRGSVKYSTCKDGRICYILDEHKESPCDNVKNTAELCACAVVEGTAELVSTFFDSFILAAWCLFYPFFRFASALFLLFLTIIADLFERVINLI